MTYREACARIGVLPGASRDQATTAALQKIEEARAAWKIAKDKLTAAEDELVAAKEIFRVLMLKGEDR
jgi:hypothetical protein